MYTVKKKNLFPHMILFAKGGLSNDDVGVARDTVFQKIDTRSGAGVKTSDFHEEKLGGLPL